VVGDTDLSYCLPDTLATHNGNFDLPELIEYLFRAMTFSWYFASLHIVHYLIFQMDTFEGGRSLALLVSMS